MTDSGGLQEEAPSLGKPVLVLRKTTERPEVISTGCGRLVGTDPIDIYNNFVELWENDFLYQKMARTMNIYGDGKSADRIVDILLKNEFHSLHGYDPEEKGLFSGIL
jgi:UDP-N-acetylglucosamine 2-epimerase (non-hydrolysing)